jgi:Excalibur calcium-binding domain
MNTRKIVLAAVAVAMLSSSAAFAEKRSAIATSKSEVTKIDLYFKNCSAARAAGYSNMLRGEAGYAPHLDRDNDDIACETR